MSKMSDLALAIQEAATELHYALDDDMPDVLDRLAVDIADEFDIDNVEWIAEEIEKAY